MRSIAIVLCAVLLAGAGYAELQNVEVGGSLRIRGNMFDMDRALNFGDTSFVEQRTRLNIKADFTDNVSALVEFDSYDIWGEDFRSQNYVLGLDGRNNGIDDVEVYQAYIDVQEMFGTPLRLRAGRQELHLGSGWLVGTNDTSAFFTGLSFDAVRLSYETEGFAVNAIAAKLAETMRDFGDGDLDFYTVYASCMAVENMTFDAYWMLMRDDMPQLGQGSDLHTVGLRGAGTVAAFDFEAEVAYQFGDIDGLNLDWEAWGVNLEAGYSFDFRCQPRVYAGFAYLEGDQGDHIPFNRLASNWEYSEFLDNTHLSNVLAYRLGLSAKPTECLKLALAATYLQADAADKGGYWFWAWEDDEDLGLELGLYADYQYSDDLVFRAGYAHFFAKEGLEDGDRIVGNGLFPWAGDDDDNYHYLFLETEISF
jgi:hypothetical protein